MMFAVLPLLLLVPAPRLVTAKDPEKTQLNEWPMVMCHDAATTYLKTGLVNKWYKTQMDGGARQELMCASNFFAHAACAPHSFAWPCQLWRKELRLAAGSCRQYGVHAPRRQYH